MTHVTNRAALRRICSITALLILLYIIIAPARASKPTPQVPDRGTAMVGVHCDLTDASPADTVTIRIVNNTDPALLRTIATELGRKLQTTPTEIVTPEINPGLVKDNGIGVQFSMPVVPPTEGYLPLAPFVEAFAPYVSKVNILYVVRGNYTYRGYQTFENKDVSITVAPPQTNWLDETTIPTSFYGIDVVIANPALTSVPITPYPPAAQPPARFPIWGILIIAAVVGAGIGLILTRLLPRRTETH